MSSETGMFRHDPVKSVLRPAETVCHRYDAEPAVVAHRRMLFERGEESRSVPVSATMAIVDGIGVIVASDDGYVRFFDQRLSTCYWERRLNRGIYASLVCDPVREAVIAVSVRWVLALVG